ncbi:APC family permease [Longimicrobium terrae]|uniref:APA family basic amino acid/polyamine antiporter n=1 Tax=Longimicrobium terrae TaxID=1639882 RepID=A0A841H5J8_9BACT|nr:amino acid permease [Longimicrobium terrae]MBB4639185.1 APA family basic amino acid/polyamine antiporter [Longimicrobium terrae]MBB6073411.1 APA family basic amino acid/polyamine antiporter [Longimicrobium terrae]NNC32601.1 amino acid permease [Longimicrobium terrae]
MTTTDIPPHGAPPAAADAELRRGLSLLDAVMLVAGSMIGSGIFIVSADIARNMGSVGGLLAVWIASGLMTLAAALSYGELAAAMPRAGGQYVFLREGLGRMPGFLYGWTLFLVIQTGTIAAVAVAFARFLGVFFERLTPDVFLPLGSVMMPGATEATQLGLSPQRVVAILVIALLTWVNLRGVREAKWIQTTLTIAKTGALAALILLGISIGRNADAIAANWSNIWSGQPGGTQVTVLGIAIPLIITAFGSAMVGSLFSSDAWNNVTFAAAEVKRPERNLPLALALGTGLVTVLYVLANIAYLSVLSLDQIKTAPQDRVGTLALEHMFGPVGQYLMAGAILVSTFGCINGLIMAGARVYFAMARDGLFFARAASVNRNDVPAWALVAQGVWTALLTLTGTYGQLLDYVIFAALIFYVLTMMALFSLRRKQPDLPRPYKAFGYPVIPALYMLSALGVALILLVAKPEYSFSGLVVVLLGIPVFFIWDRRTRAA